MRRDERILIDPLMRTATRFADNAGGFRRRESERELFDRLSRLARSHKAAITQLRGIVTPDPGGDNTGPNYGTGVKEVDYSPIPRLDLPFGYADWVGDDAWGRHASPRHNNAAKRSGDHAINWLAPSNQP